MPISPCTQPPPRKDERRGAPERFAFVRDGFYFWAFLLAPLWMLLAPAVAGAVRLCCRQWRAHGRAAAARRCRRRVQFAVAVAVVALLVGFEAATLRRWTLRGGAGARSALWSATTSKTAERRFFADWAKQRRARRRRLPPAPPAPSPMRRARAADVIGLFPEPETAWRDERRHRRLRLGQSALGGQGLRARGARERPRSADRGDRDPDDGARAPTASCCRASAPSPTAGAGSTRCPAWSRRWRERCASKGRPFLGICVGMQLMAERGREYG